MSALFWVSADPSGRSRGSRPCRRRGPVSPGLRRVLLGVGPRAAVPAAGAVALEARPFFSIHEVTARWYESSRLLACWCKCSICANVPPFLWLGKCRQGNRDERQWKGRFASQPLRSRVSTSSHASSFAVNAANGSSSARWRLTPAARRRRRRAAHRRRGGFAQPDSACCGGAPQPLVGGAEPHDVEAGGPTPCSGLPHPDILRFSPDSSHLPFAAQRSAITAANQRKAQISRDKCKKAESTRS